MEGYRTRRFLLRLVCPVASWKPFPIASYFAGAKTNYLPIFIIAIVILGLLILAVATKLFLRRYQKVDSVHEPTATQRSRASKQGEIVDMTKTRNGTKSRRRKKRRTESSRSKTPNTAKTGLEIPYEEKIEEWNIFIKPVNLMHFLQPKFLPIFSNI